MKQFSSTFKLPKPLKAFIILPELLQPLIDIFVNFSGGGGGEKKIGYFYIIVCYCMLFLMSVNGLDSTNVKLMRNEKEAAQTSLCISMGVWKVNMYFMLRGRRVSGRNTCSLQQ